MKTAWYEGVKAYVNKLLPAVIILAFVANGAIFYNSLIGEKEDSFLARNVDAYDKIIDDYKEESIQQAYEELKKLNDDLQAFINIQMLAQNTFGESQQEIDSELKQIEDKNPGILKKYGSHDYKLYSGSLETDAGLVNDVFNQADYIHGYSDYVSSMTDRMNDMLSVSVFYKKGTFAYRNIVKTPQDFVPLKDIPLKLDTSWGIVRSTDFELTDVFILGIALLICIYLISVEKDRGLLLLVKSTQNGRGRVIVSKFCVLALSMGVVSLLFYGSDILIAKQVFGLGTLARYVQSIPDFRGCTVLMTVGQYLDAFLLSKIFVIVLFALIVFAVILLSSSSSFAYTLIITIVSLEWTAWKFIGTTSYINHLKFINIFSFLNVFNLFSTYQNLNILGQPVNIRLLFFTVVPACLIALAVLCYISFLKLSFNEKTGIISRMIDRIRLSFSKLPGHVSLFLHELYKLLISQKALLILALLLLFQYHAVTNFFVVRNQDQIIFQHYLLEIDGKLTDKTREYIANEQIKFDNEANMEVQAADDLKNNRITQAEYNGIINRGSIMQERTTAFGWITQQYSYLDAINKEKGIDAWFVDPMGYTRLFSLDGYGDDAANELLVTGTLIACLAAAFAHENAIKSKKITITCREGRGRAILQKYLSCYLIAVVMAVLVYGVQFYNIFTGYHLTDWNAPVQSVMSFNGTVLSVVPQFNDFSFHITIGQYALIMYGIRLAGILATVSLILLLSSVSNSVFISIFVSTAVLEVPTLLYLLGFNDAKYFSFVEILSSNMLLANPNPMTWMIVIPTLCIGWATLALCFAKQIFCKINFIN